MREIYHLLRKMIINLFVLVMMISKVWLILSMELKIYGKGEIKKEYRAVIFDEYKNINIYNLSTTSSSEYFQSDILKWVFLCFFDLECNHQGFQNYSLLFFPSLSKMWFTFHSMSSPHFDLVNIRKFSTICINPFDFLSYFQITVYFWICWRCLG